MSTVTEGDVVTYTDADTGRTMRLRVVQARPGWIEGWVLRKDGQVARQGYRVRGGPVRSGYSRPLYRGITPGQVTAVEVQA